MTLELQDILRNLRAAGGVADAVELSDRTGMSREELEPYLEDYSTVRQARDSARDAGWEIGRDGTVTCPDCQHDRGERGG